MSAGYATNDRGCCEHTGVSLTPLVASELSKIRCSSKKLQLADAAAAQEQMQHVTSHKNTTGSTGLDKSAMTDMTTQPVCDVGLVFVIHACSHSACTSRLCSSRANVVHAVHLEYAAQGLVVTLLR